MTRYVHICQRCHRTYTAHGKVSYTCPHCAKEKRQLTEMFESLRHKIQDDDFDPILEEVKLKEERLRRALRGE
jgi:uncharacterized Zn ribbon protein